MGAAMKRTSTIFALSSGALPSGVAVVRVSGDGARRAAEALCGALPPPRRLALRRLLAEDNGVIDRGLVAYVPAPDSFTGEDCAEFHVHGGRAVVAALLDRLGGLEDMRQAEAGEFTRRAFVNGKLDLTEAEALSDLIASETEAQRRLALANADGRQHTLYAGWRARLLHARAMIEAELDFSDEGDVPGSVAAAVWGDVVALRAEMEGHLAGFRAAEIVREGFRVAIVGAPNAGKSSLLNYLAGRDVAIVSDEPGTTRDVLEVSLDLGGWKVILADTAGLRAEAGRVEMIGIERAHRIAASADLVLLLEDMADPHRVEVPGAAPALRVGTKLDLKGGELGPYDLAISTVSGAGIDLVLFEIETRAKEKVSVAESGVVPTRQRHVDLLRSAMAGLSGALDDERQLELRVEGLRIASDDVGRVSGAIDTEEILAAIFSTFCIGK
jgi:tRNA modification GTPase